MQTLCFPSLHIQHRGHLHWWQMCLRRHQVAPKKDRGCEIWITVVKIKDAWRWWKKWGIWWKRGKRDRGEWTTHNVPWSFLWLSECFWSRNSSLPFTHSAFFFYSSIWCIFHQPQYSISQSQYSLPALHFCPLEHLSPSTLAFFKKTIRGFSDLLCLMRMQSISFFFSLFYIHIRCVFLCLLHFYTCVYSMCVMYCEVPKRQF